MAPRLKLAAEPLPQRIERDNQSHYFSSLLERLRNFFGFGLDAGWIGKNPATAVRPPKITQSPTLPFEPEEFERILSACDSYSTKGVHREGNRIRLKAMILLLRYSGLRIRDAATLERSRIKHAKLFLYTQKTGTPVWLPLPPVVLAALDQVTNINGRYFSGQATATQKRLSTGSGVFVDSLRAPKSRYSRILGARARSKTGRFS